VAPTPYRASGTDGSRFGYDSTKLTDQLYRVRFVGSGRTPARWGEAFLLYRCAELANEAKAPAFKIVEGYVDTTVLSGEDVFGSVDLDAEVLVTLASRRTSTWGDAVVGNQELSTGMRPMAGAMPVFRMPPPPLPKYQPPIYIYTPGYAAPVLPDRSVLVELRPDLKDMDHKTFVTADVLGKLGPRIKRTASDAAAPGLPAPSSL
jgi:hypothetical protein